MARMVDRRHSLSSPRWGRALIRQIAADYGCTYVPRVRWTCASDGLTLGGCQPSDVENPNLKRRAGEIFLADGLDEQGQRYVLIHELAHWLLPQDEGHSNRFNQVASELYRKYMPPFTVSIRPLRLKSAVIE